MSRECHDNTVAQRVQSIILQFAVGSDAVQHLFPDGAQIVLLLQAVGIAHVLEHVRLDGTLERADAYYLHLHTNLVEQFLHIRGDRGHTVQVNSTHRVQVDAVGNAGQVVVCLVDALVAVGGDPLAALLELLQCASQGLEGCWCGANAVTLQVDAFHLVVFGRILDGRDCSIQSQTVGHVALEQRHHV